MSAILEVRNLRTVFETGSGVVNAVNGTSFSVDPGEAVGIVGESGSGKSATALSIMRLIPEPPGKTTADAILFQGRDLLTLSSREMLRIRGKEIGMVFQDPMSSLNPVLTIERQLREPLERHLNMSTDKARKRSIELLRMVGIHDPANRVDAYPHQFSGGMRQRVMIAMALAAEPKLLIADEPTTALDVTVQADIVDLIKSLRTEFGLAVIWITHDLGLLAGFADRILVMYAGQIAEEAPTRQLYGNPRHPYTMGLLRSIPHLRSDRSIELKTIVGNPPDMVDLPPGCSFRPRCEFAVEKCQENPPLLHVEEGHNAACWVCPEPDQTFIGTSQLGGVE